MNIHAKCSCGARFQARPEFAGKRAKCPSCGKPFTLPAAVTKTDYICVSCQCGKTFKAKAALAGKRVKCPSCSAPLTIVERETSTRTSVGTPNEVKSRDDPLGLGQLPDDPLALNTLPPTDTLPKVCQSAPVPRPIRKAKRIPKRPLATRLSRLGAAIIDALVATVWQLLAMGLTGAFGRMANQGMTMTESMLWGVGGMCGYLLVNGYFLATRGQSIGKLLLGIRIVDNESNQILPFAKLVGLRLLPVWAISLVPCLGIFATVDVLWIFGQEQRCLHDLIADTKVVEV